MLAAVILLLLNIFLSLIWYLFSRILEAQAEALSCGTWLHSGCVSTIVTAAKMSVLSVCLVDLEWGVPVRKWCLLNVLRCEKLLWNSEEMEQINDRIIHWMLLNTYLFKEMPALKIIRWRLWVCIRYAVTFLKLFLAAVFEDCWRWDIGNTGWPSTPVLALLCRMFLEAVASFLGDSLT